MKTCFLNPLCLLWICVNILTQSYPKYWIATWDFIVRFLNVRISANMQAGSHIKISFRSHCLTSRHPSFRYFMIQLGICSKKPKLSPGIYSLLSQHRLQFNEAIWGNVLNLCFISQLPLSFSTLENSVWCIL